MNSSKIIAVAALALLATVGAQAQTAGRSRAEVNAEAVAAARAPQAYEGSTGGVTQIAGTADRSAVRAQAVAAAQTPLAYDGSLGGVTQVSANSTVDRSAVRAQAVAASHDPTQNLDRKSFVNSTIPAQFRSIEFRSQQASK